MGFVLDVRTEKSNLHKTFFNYNVLVWLSVPVEVGGYYIVIDENSVPIATPNSAIYYKRKELIFFQVMIIGGALRLRLSGKLF